MSDEPASRDPQLQELADERDIRRVVMDFARGSDRHDFDLLRKLYHEGAHDNHGVYVGDAGDYIDWCEENLPQMGGVSMHFTNLPIVDFESPTVARSEAYIAGVFRYTREDGTTSDWRAGGRYADHLEKRDGTWRLTSRTLIWEWAADEAVKMEFEGFGLDTSNFVWSKRGREDALYAHEK